MKEKIISDNAGLKYIAQIFILYIAIVGYSQMFAFQILGIEIGIVPINISIFQKLVLVLFTFFGTTITVWICRVYLDRGTFKSLGFDSFKWRELFAGLLSGCIIMSFGYIVLIYFKEISYIKTHFNSLKFGYSVIIFVLVAISEEMLIRGYVLNSLMKSINKYLALLISSVIFSIMHIANPNYSLFSAFELFLSGIFLGISYIHKRNLVFPIALHFSWNFFQGTIFGFNVSGLDGYSLIIQKRLENNIWNGGEFGFEGSVIAMILQVICIIILYLYFSKKTDAIKLPH